MLQREASSSLDDEARSDVLMLNELVNELREYVNNLMKWKDELSQSSSQEPASRSPVNILEHKRMQDISH